MLSKPTIHLYDSCGIGIIIQFPSGVFYSNQTGGLTTKQSIEEGVFVPLFSEAIDQEKLLIDYFTGPKWEGLCGYNIDNETADFVDHVLSLIPGSEFVKVDRSRLQDSHEAWIYVEISEASFPPVIENFGKCKGVLIWANSD
jgi:hypothetical protein